MSIGLSMRPRRASPNRQVWLAGAAGYSTTRQIKKSAAGLSVLLDAPHKIPLFHRAQPVVLVDASKARTLSSGVGHSPGCTSQLDATRSDAWGRAA